MQKVLHGHRFFRAAMSVSLVPLPEKCPFFCCNCNTPTVTVVTLALLQV